MNSVAHVTVLILGQCPRHGRICCFERSSSFRKLEQLLPLLGDLLGPPKCHDVAEPDRVAMDLRMIDAEERCRFATDRTFTVIGSNRKESEATEELGGISHSSP